MAIDPLQADARQLSETRFRSNSKGASAFATMLASSIGAGNKGGAPDTGQSAAELLRMEMMRSSLALAEEAATVEPASRQALRSLLAAVSHLSPSRHLAPERADGAALDQPEELKNRSEAAGAAGVEATAAHYLGTPYRFGGEGRDGIDCSRFVQQVYLEHGVDLPRTAHEQIQVGRDVAKGDLQKGDLVFFQTYASYASHVGIYLGDGKMIHASSERGEVTVSDMDSDYYRSRYLGAKRVA